MKNLKTCLLASALSISLTAFAGPNVDPIQLSSTPQTGYFDFGDAPDSYGTTLASNGARHGDGTKLYLGRPTGGGAPDYETNTMPAIAPGGFALWDDVNGSANNEETGVAFLGSFTQNGGNTMCNPDPLFYQSGCWGRVDVTVTVNDRSNSGAVFLDGWLDWGHDGTFDEGLEHILTASWNPADLSGWSGDTQTFTYWFYDGPGPNGPFYARFRISEAANTPTGERALGEVEDYGGLGHGQGVPEIDVTSGTSALALLLGSLALLGERRRRHSSIPA